MKIKISRNEWVHVASYFAIVLVSVLLLYVGNMVATKNLTIFENRQSQETIQAVITDILYKWDDKSTLEDGSEINNKEIYFEAEVKSGAQKGEKVKGVQNISGMYIYNAKEIAVGNSVVLSSYTDDEWYFIDYIRINKILILVMVFTILLLLFGRIKGFNAILSLGLTCTAIFAVFIPALLSGKNIYLFSILVCVYSVVTTLFIVNGINRKSIAAILGCLVGIFLIGLLTFFANQWIGLSGLVNEETQLLLYLPLDEAIDLRAIIFAAILIGAVGAIMDVGMSIASALWEVKETSENVEFAALLKSGMNIGQDVMGTMTNTLVLAYIGSSLSIVLLLTVYITSFTELLNRELVIVEFMQALIGSFGILLTMPLTTFISATLYTLGDKEKTVS